MGLKKLTGGDIAGLEGRPVCLVRFSQGYLDELYAVYPDFPILAGVIDSTPARVGRKELRGRTLAIYGMERLKTVLLESPSNMIYCEQEGRLAGIISTGDILRAYRAGHGSVALNKDYAWLYYGE